MMQVRYEIQVARVFKSAIFQEIRNNNIVVKAREKEKLKAKRKKKKIKMIKNNLALWELHLCCESIDMRWMEGCIIGDE